MTKIEAIACVMNDNGGVANWNIIYKKTKSFYPDVDTSPNWKEGLRGVLYREINNGRMFKKLSDGLFALKDYDENNLLINDDNTVTEQERIVNTRLRQSELRKSVIKHLRHCPITGIDDERLLVVSHIKPWAFSTNIERLDINNTFLLSPLFDKLFDSGLITFSKDKTLHISSELSASNCGYIGISQGQRITALPINKKRTAYLEYHKDNIFII